MRDLLRPMLPMILVLAVPIVPFLLFGQQVEAALQTWQERPPAPGWVALAVIALLATDIFLPIPSSLVSTLAGWQLGAALGAMAAWIGMNLGAVLGFALARGWGRPFVARWTRPADLDRTNRLAARFGPALLVLGRGVPVLAEATVLLVGMHGLSWRAFLPPVMLANLGLALAYAVLGTVAERYEWLPLALAVSIALPVLMVAAFRSLAKAPENTTAGLSSSAGGGAAGEARIVPNSHLATADETHHPTTDQTGRETRPTTLPSIFP